MKLVYTAQNMLLVGHLRNILESEGIHCLTRNEYLAGGAGELPPTETWPELWVEERDAAREALARVEALVSGEGRPDVAFGSMPFKPRGMDSLVLHLGDVRAALRGETR